MPAEDEVDARQSFGELLIAGERRWVNATSTSLPLISAKIADSAAAIGLAVTDPRLFVRVDGEADR